MNAQEDSGIKSKNNRILFISLGVAGVLLLCCTVALILYFSGIFSNTPQLLTKDAKPPHFGVFVKQNSELIELQEREIFSITTEGEMANAEVISDSQPIIIVWRNETNLDYLEFVKLNQYLGQSKNSIRYNATPKEDGVIEITPASRLDDGIYCLIQGDPLAALKPGWCFRIGETINNLPAPTRVVYFIAGHGEKVIEQAGETSMTRAKTTLESKNYAVKMLNLLVDNQIPEDASLIVIAGPLQPVSQKEVDLLKEYLTNGGSLIVMEDPTALTDFGDEADPLAEMLATDWGITLNNDIVVDLNSTQPTTAAAAIYGSHPITTSMNDLVSFYPFTRSLSATGTVDSVTLISLVQTNERSWGETDMQSLTTGGGEVGFDEGIETPGPLVLAFAGENTTSGGRVVVFGTSLFAVDQVFDQYCNGDIFINSVDWAIVRN